MKYNRSEIMKKAWEMRRLSVRNLKGSKWEPTPFAECLRRAWREAKEAVRIAAMVAENKKYEWGYIIPLWLLKEKEICRYDRIVNGECFIPESKIERSTKKAFRVYGEWFPMSQCDYIKVAV